MMDVTVKTLDGQNRNYSLPETLTVREFKERISTSINIPPDTQRLIFHGKVMQDDKMLKDYDVHGKVIHVVQRAPPSTRVTSSTTTTSATVSGSGAGANIFEGSFTMPSEAFDPTQIQNMVQQAVAGMGEGWTNARVSTRSSADGSSLDVHVHVDQTQDARASATARLGQARLMLGIAREAINTLEAASGEESPSSEHSSDRGDDDETESDMDTSSPTRTTPPETSSQSDARREPVDQSNVSTDEGSQTDPTSSTAGTQTGSARRAPPEPATLTSMSELMTEIADVQLRLQPHFARLRDLLAEESDEQSERGQENQRLFNHVLESLHALGHCYHSISDIACNMTRQPVRLEAVSAHRLPGPGGFMPATFIPGMPPGMGHQHVRFGQPQVVMHTFNAGQPRPAAPTTNAATTTPTTGTTSTAATTSATITAQTPSMGVPSFAASSDPYVYVEVGPDSVTVNSISAHVIATESPGPGDVGTAPTATTAGANSETSTTGTSTTAASTTSTTSTATSTPTGTSPGIPGIQGILPDMMQNILSSVLQQHGHRQGQPVHINMIPVPMSGMPGMPIPGGINITRVPNPAAMRMPVPNVVPRTTAPQTGTAPSASTPTTAASATRIPTAGVIPGARVIGPIPVGRRGHRHQDLIDCFLPCNSRHFLTPRARNVAHHSHGIPETMAVFDNILSEFANQNGQPRTAPASVAPGGPTSTRPTTGTSQAPTQTTASQSGPMLANPFAAMLSGMQGLQPAAAPGGGITTQAGGANMALEMMRNMFQGVPVAANPPEQNAQGNTPMSDDMFARLVAGISGHLTQAVAGGGGQEDQVTIGDFLSSYMNDPPGEGFIHDVIQCLCQQITFSDLFQILFGNPVPLNRLRTPLREFICERVLNGEEYTDANLEAGVNRVVENVQSEIDEAVIDARVKDNIDLNATLRELIRRNLMKICEQVMESPQNDADFGQHLHERVRRLLEEFVVLTTDCLTEGAPAFERILHSRLQHMTTGMNPMIQSWMMTLTSQQLHNFRHHVTITPAEVQRFILRPSTATTSKETASAKPRSDSPMDTDEKTTSKKTPSAKKPTIPPKPTSLGQSMRTSATPASPTTAVPGKRTYVNGTGASSDGASPASPPTDEDESWQGVVPADWVPIISRDISRQGENGVQRPFSDVYAQGIPPKRRRIMSMERPDNLNNMSEYMTESIQRAAHAAGVQPISSTDNLISEASEEIELHDSLNNEVDRVLAQRLQTDTDYKSERYPQARDYFKRDRT